MIGAAQKLECGETYIVSPKHRKKKATKNACVWKISSDEEIDCFSLAIKNKWVKKDDAWAILTEEKDNFIILGVNYKGHYLKIAKFRKDVTNWHGYPADNNNRPQDRPPTELLTIWQEKGLISKPMRARIQGGRL